LLALASLLVFVPAPTYALWLVGVLAGEVAPQIFLLAVVLLAMACLAWRRHSHLKMAAFTAALAAFAALAAGFQIIDIVNFARSHGYEVSLTDCLRFRKFDEKSAVKLMAKEYARPGGRPLELDVYQPSAPTKAHPALLVVHGGGWRHGRRSDLAQYDLWLAGLGYTVFDLDYRLADGTVHFPLPVEDIETALEWIKQHALDYDVDAKRVCLMGRSAGAQLALVAAYRGAQAGPARARCVIALYGPTDMPWDYDNPLQPDVINCREVLTNYLGGPPAALPDLYAQASACALVSEATPPTLFIHGERDQIVSHLNVDRLAPRLKEHNRPFQYLCMPWANHGFDWHFSGLSSQISRQVIAKFLRDYL
jgi:acetyl esterase/lipase